MIWIKYRTGSCHGPGSPDFNVPVPNQLRFGTMYDKVQYNNVTNGYLPYYKFSNIYGTRTVLEYLGPDPSREYLKRYLLLGIE
jgi:hypothetical protein